MKILFYLIWLLPTLCCAKADAVTPSRLFGRPNMLAKRQNPNNPSASLPVRRSLPEFQNDRISWSLFILSLTRLQDRPESDQYSFFRISGIHGRPYVAWGDSPQAPGATDTGYCTHNSILFPTWHRPYCWLFETQIIAEAQQIASQFKTDTAKYQEAARQLRVPFWDWAENSRLPDIVTQTSIQIDTPDGPQTVRNPMYQYRFHDRLDPTLFPSNSPDGWFSRFLNTARGINSQRPDTPNNIGNVNSCMQSSDFPGDVWRLLVRSKNYNTFSSTVTRGISIEGIHNTLHSCVGGRYGHMAYLSFAAYDPIFMMHHANVDRLFALWQVLNPDSYLEPEQDSMGNFVIPPGTVVDTNTPLAPFRVNTGGTYWTSATSRNINTFSYTYPELAGNLSGEQLRASVTTAINKLYNPQQSVRRRHLNMTEHDDSDHFAPVREWSLDMGVSKFDLGGERFKILIFIGGVPENSDDWETSDTFAGSFVVFPPPHPSRLDHLPRFMTYSEINIDRSLQKHGCDSENLPEVIKFLKENLQWRVQKFDGTVINPQEVNTLSISLQCHKVKLPRHNRLLPIYGEKSRKIYVFKPGDLDGVDDN